MRTFTILTLLLPVLLLGCNKGSGPTNVGNIDPIDNFVAPDRFIIEYEGQEVHTPMISSHSLTESHPEIERVLFVVPSSTRTILDKYEWLTNAVEEQGIRGTTMIVGIQFLENVDMGVYDLEPEIPVWLNEASQWSSGNPADGLVSGDHSIELSSFTIIDSVWTSILNVCPNVGVFLMTGNSAGGATTNHYAAATTIPSQYPDVKFGFVPTNMVTTLYFSPERVVPGTVDQFAIPNTSRIASCPGYNFYPTGLIGLNTYMSQFTDDEIKSRYADRSIVYFVGDQDDTNYGHCQLEMMGEDNYHRNIIYYNYLQHVFGHGITDHQSLVVINGASHNGSEIFNTEQYHQVICNWVPGEAMSIN